jgi:hypothetical protein
MLLDRLAPFNNAQSDASANPSGRPLGASVPANPQENVRGWARATKFGVTARIVSSCSLHDDGHVGRPAAPGGLHCHFDVLAKRIEKFQQTTDGHGHRPAAHQR